LAANGIRQQIGKLQGAVEAVVREIITNRESAAANVKEIKEMFQARTDSDDHRFEGVFDELRKHSAWQNQMIGTMRAWHWILSIWASLLTIGVGLVGVALKLKGG